MMAQVGPQHGRESRMQNNRAEAYTHTHTQGISKILRLLRHYLNREHDTNYSSLPVASNAYLLKLSPLTAPPTCELSQTVCVGSLLQWTQRDSSTSSITHVEHTSYMKLWILRTGGTVIGCRLHTYTPHSFCSLLTVRLTRSAQSRQSSDHLQSPITLCHGASFTAQPTRFLVLLTTLKVLTSFLSTCSITT